MPEVNQDLPLEAMNLYAVADGMGGHVGGEVAAQVAVEALLRVFTREPTKAGLRDAFDEANSAVSREGQEHSELRGMGTTLTALALVGGDDGRDSSPWPTSVIPRAYLFSDGQIVQVTADHSLAEERMRHGEMTEEEAAVHPQRHILTRALGVSSEVEADMWDLQLRSGDRLVLCSDGLSNELTSDELAEVLSRVPDPGEAAQQLVEIANEHGGSDNITVVVVDVVLGGETPAEASVITPLGGGPVPPLLVGPGSVAGAAFAPGGAPGKPGQTPSPREPSWASAVRPGRYAATACARVNSFRTRRRRSRCPGPPTVRSRRPRGASPLRHSTRPAVSAAGASGSRGASPCV